MWIKLIIGALAGLVVGHFVTPGYALWVVVGIIVGFLADLLTKKLARTNLEKKVEKD